MRDERKQFTPGPWIVAPYTEAQVQIREQDNEGGRVLAVVDDADEQDRANARLIAAAPDLLAALREIEERADSNAQDVDENSDEHSGFIRIRDDARAAISKAEGR